MIIILIHELGHFLTAKILNWKTDKIYLYPYGGISKFNTNVNIRLREEFLVLIMGPLTQIIFFILVRDFISPRYLDTFTKYNEFILIFNLLPIYPLDGGKLLMIILSYIYPFKKSFKLTSIIGYIAVSLTTIVAILNKSAFFILIMIFILTKLIDEIKIFKLIFQKFILERTNNIFSYRKTLMINNIDDMKKDDYHLIKRGNQYIEEKQYLRNLYKS